MKRENFEIKKVCSGEPNSTTTWSTSYEIKRNGKCILKLSYEELLELTQLCKDYTDCNLPSRLLYSDEELINALKERGYKGKLTKTTNIEL